MFYVSTEPTPDWQLDELIDFCVRIGNDRLLVQGSGGNVSVKVGEKMLVKASGQRLDEAAVRNIFTQVEFTRTPTYANSTGVLVTVDPSQELPNPSIEVSLHALFRQKFVLHLHAVAAVAHLVRPDPKAVLSRCLDQKFSWAYLPYIRPGIELGSATSSRLAACPLIDVLFLGNHGVVIASDEIDGLDNRLRWLTELLGATLNVESTESIAQTEQFHPLLRRRLGALGYRPTANEHFHNLVRDQNLMRRLRQDWRITPDNVVFLGVEPLIVSRWFSLPLKPARTWPRPPFIFVPGDVVYESLECSDAARDQLQFFCDVILRVPTSEQINSLSLREGSELLDWDQEKYRRQLAARKLTSGG